VIKRPVLKPGDVCKNSNKVAGKRRRVNQDMTMVVIEVKSGDGSDRYSRIKCAVTEKNQGPFTRSSRGVYSKSFMRQHLWFTGYNINDGKTTKSKCQGKQQQFRAVNEVMNNDGRETCYICGSATEFVMGFSSAYNCCVKSGCKWKGN